MNLFLYVDRIPTPIGELAIGVDREGRLRGTHWTEPGKPLDRTLVEMIRGRTLELEETSDPHGISAAITAYFAGDLHAIDAIPVEVEGTEFQRAVLGRAARDPVRNDDLLRRARAHESAARPRSAPSGRRTT